MNTNQISSKPGTRLNRIRIVSRIFRTLIGIGVAIMLLISLWALMDSVLVLLGAKIVPGQSMTVTLNPSPSQSLVFPYDMSLPVLIFGAMHFCFVGVGIVVLNRLFMLYEINRFFAADNVRYIKILGLVVAGDGLIQTILELLASHGTLCLNEMFFGGLIILIAWIMDEGRKIQEEQELTV
jgi:hypothetical protein